MDRMKIAAIFADQEQLGGKEITVCGWARTIRDMKTFGFIELNDGSCFRNLQVVMSADELHNYKEIASQNVGAALIVRGTVVLTPEAKQPLELKAAAKERLGEALEKYEKLTSKFYKEFNKQGDILEILQNITNPAKKYRTRFLISGEDKLFTLQVDDIAYFYSENKITFAVTNQNKEHIIDLSLDKLCEQLDPDRFFRTNRQTIVSVQAIQKIESYFLGKVVVKVIPPFKDKIIVSREKISAFKLWLNY